MKNDEFQQKEIQTDRLADYTAEMLIGKGYTAYSQSEENIISTGFYDKTNKSTPLPHKTIALIAGLGWIGNHNLLITPEYGSAVSMCTVLTDAPLKTVSHTPEESKCGNCTICKQICAVDAIHGESWTRSTSRDALVDIDKCTTCLQCLALCPWTQEYLRRNFE
jgi:epoxyqueuosine reductase QueG